MSPEHHAIPVGGGVLPVDKPTGVTSFDVIRAARRAFCTRAAGHAGTLDPMASGLLLLCIGPATRLSGLLMAGRKTYRAAVRLGVETDTDDADGRPMETAAVPSLDRAGIEAALSPFTGEIMQTPPVYSALKQDGQPLYRRARRGEAVRPEPRPVTIHRIDIVGYGQDLIEIEVECGKGTYIRSLARDLGRHLGSRGHLHFLRRTRCAGFDVERALTLKEIASRPADLGRRLIPPLEALPDLPRRSLDDDELRRVGWGQAVPAREPHPDGSAVLLVAPAGCLAAVATASEGLLRPRRVFPV